MLDCDFRNPQIPDLLDAQPGVGLSDVLATDPANDLQHLIRPTAVAGVSVVGAERLLSTQRRCCSRSAP